jgi:hypothetical protein
VVEVGENDWCILRTQSANTLGLAKTLAESGWRAWTPTEVILDTPAAPFPARI